MNKEVHIQIFEDTHKKLKILSSIEGKSMKKLIMEMVDIKFKKEWRQEWNFKATPEKKPSIKLRNIEPEKFKGRKVVRF